VAALLATIVVSFVMLPVVLPALGDERYGAWSFVESFVAYLTLFDLGVAAALVRFVPRFVARNDHAELNRVYSASLTFFSFGAVVALFIGGVFEWLLLDRVLPSADYANEIRWLFRLLVLNFGLSLPMSVFPAILDGLGEFLFKSSVRTIMLGIRAALTIIALTYEQRLIALGIVITGCQIVEYLWLAAGARRLLPRLRFRPREVDRQTIKEVAGYSGAAFVAMISGRLAFHTDAFVIGPTLGTAFITLFAVPAMLVEKARSVLRAATTTLTGAFSAFESAGQIDRLRSTFLAGTQAAWTAALPIQCGLLILGKPFLEIWLGNNYRDTFAPVLWVLAPLLSLTIAQSVASRVLYGTGDLRSFAWAAVIEGISNLALSLILIRLFGVVGVAIGTAIPHAVMCLWVITYVCRQHSIGVSEYLAQLVVPVAAIVAPAMIWSRFLAHGITDWITFIAAGATGVAAYLAIIAAWIAANRVVKMRLGRLRVSPLPMRRAG